MAPSLGSQGAPSRAASLACSLQCWLCRTKTQPESVVLEVLDAACRARLLKEEDAGYQFAHDVIREVVEAGIGQGRRQALHRRSYD